MKNRPRAKKNYPGTMKNHENRPRTMKNHPGTMKNHENQPGTMKNQPGTIKTIKSNHEKVIIFCYTHFSLLTGDPTDLLDVLIAHEYCILLDYCWKILPIGRHRFL